MHAAVRLALILIYVAVVGLCPHGAFAQASSDDRDPVAVAIQGELDKLMDPDVMSVQGARIALRELIQEFYTKRGFRAAWNNARNAEQLRKALADSYDDGLDPADYHLPLLENLSQQVSEPGSTPMLRAQYDILLTEALLRLAYHLSFGKVDPETFDAQWNYGRTLASANVAQEVEQALAAEDVYQRVEALKPTHPLYMGLKRDLVRFRAAKESDAPPRIPTGSALKPGMSDARIPLVRRRLAASGDLTATDASESLE